MKFIKKHKDYFLVGGISFSILLIIFILKRIFPFGNNSLIYSDMYDQVTSFSYYFKDSLFGNTSLMINFHNANGVNFLGTIAYYILSPFTFLTLLVKRKQIHLVISIMIAFKIIVSNITMLYMLKKLFKKLNNLSVMLAILYGFSIYSLNYYVITAWIDCMYMLPLVVVGLKKLFDGEKPTLYIISLFLIIVMNFYIGAMVIIFIFLLSYFYIWGYCKDKRGENILMLGISTVQSLLLAGIILLPTLSQYLASSRKVDFLEKMLNSKMGPLSDKIVLFLFGPILFILIILLIKDYKKNKEFLKFYIPSMILLLIPVIVEPVNKLLHFGSYYFFTYRFGFITTLFIILGATYYLNNLEIKDSKSSKKKKLISISILVITTILVGIILSYKYNDLQFFIESLTLSTNKMLILILMLAFFVVLVASILVIIIEGGINKFSGKIIALLSLVHIFGTSYVYIGMDFVNDTNNGIYHDLQMIYDDREEYGIYKYKDETVYILKNSSLITGVPGMDSFNSLTDSSSQDSLKLLGYTSFQTRTHSMGGTLFSDCLLGNKYVLNMKDDKELYKLKKKYNDLYMYEFNKDISFGYKVKDNVSINDANNAFEAQNAIYESITGDKKIFDIIPIYDTYNMNINKNDYKISDKDNYVEFKVDVNNESKVYLEILKDIDFSINRNIYELFDVYVNDKLVKSDYPTLNDNGILDLGIFKNTTVEVKVKFKDSCTLKSLNVGVMEIEKLYEFLDNEKLDYKINFNENKINIDINSNDESILFLPINYSDGYEAYKDKEKIELVKLYDNYIGVPLKKGDNNISLKYVSPKLGLGIIVSLVGLLITIILLTFNGYKLLKDINILGVIAKWIYLILYVGIMLIIYILPVIAFLISFVKYISI